MDETLKPLVERAFGMASALEANAAIAEARDALHGARPTSYEVLVKDGQGLAELAAAVLPRLVYHLDSLGARPPQWGEVFLSLFVGEHLHFIHVAEAMPLLLETQGLAAHEALVRFGAFDRRRTEGASSPLLLGAGPPRE